MDGSPPVRCAALTLVGRTRLRRGEPGAVETLREAWQVAVRLRECSGSARPPRHWPKRPPQRRRQCCRHRVTEAQELARRFGKVAVRAELAYWLAARAIRRRARPDHPYALLADADGRKPQPYGARPAVGYEYATALAESPDPADQLTALRRTGAQAQSPCRVIRTSLKTQGVSRIPRGPTPTTRFNPAGLTNAKSKSSTTGQGLTNPESPTTGLSGPHGGQPRAAAWTN